MSVLYAPNLTEEEAKAAAARRARLVRLHVIKKPLASVVSEIVELPPIPNDAFKVALRQIHGNRPTMDEIKKTVAKHYGITVDDILSRRRAVKVCRPRQVAMYLMKTLTLRSYPEIGHYVGDRDHTTALSNVRKIERLMSSDATLVADIDVMKSQLGCLNA